MYDRSRTKCIDQLYDIFTVTVDFIYRNLNLDGIFLNLRNGVSLLLRVLLLLSQKKRKKDVTDVNYKKISQKFLNEYVVDRVINMSPSLTSKSLSGNKSIHDVDPTENMTKDSINIGYVSRVFLTPTSLF